ncbi:MAG TPA: TonB-dependent receptor, partial [Longimicrobiaceae bacterium]|nr:TonB-dependent receptor [Longimicrobiaceae bacterium]
GTRGRGNVGTDLNTIPVSAIERIEILRDGAAAQYGSDAIAGVVNVVLKNGVFAPQVTADLGRYQPNDWAPDGATIGVAGGTGIRVGRGWVALFGEFRNREATNRAGADPEDQLVPGDADLVEDGRVIEKNNPVPQPTYHWGDGLQRDYLGFVNALFPLDRQLNHQLYAFGGYGWRRGIGNGYFRHGISERNWPQIYPQGFLPAFEPHVVDATGSAGVRGIVSGWRYDAGATYGHNLYRFNITNSLNTSLGPCLDTACAPGADGVLGTADDPGIPNQTAFDAGALVLHEAIAILDLARGFEVGLASPLHVAVGAAFRQERYRVEAGEPASYLQGWHPDRYGDIAPPGSQVFPGFRPANEADESRHNFGVYADLEADVAPRFLANVAGRFESYSDFGEALTGKLALRYQPSPRWTLRGALSTGFRAPSLSQSWYGSTSTNFAPDETTGEPEAFDVGFFPVASEAAQALGARPLREETSLNASAGFAVTPADGINLAVDYFFIDLDDRIMLTTDLAGPEVEAILAARGLAVQAARYFTNVVHSQTQGVDVTASWRIPLDSARALSLNAVLNWTKTDIVDDIPLPPELEGTGTVLIDPFWEGGLLALERERPRWRTAVSGRYETGAWGFLARASSYGKYESALYCYCEETVQEYRSQTLFDVEASRNFTGRGKLAVGVRNLFDTFPPKMIEENSFGIFIYPPASPFGYNGRFVYVRMEFGIGR